MPDRAHEVQQLALADGHILLGERRVADLTGRVAAETARGTDSAQVSDLLATARETLALFRDHREHIAQTIRDIDAGLW